MILLSELLDEDGEAAQQAKQMGLISKGWGRWADPRTGKVTHKTDGGRLVAVDPTTDTGPSDDDHEGWQDSPDGRSTTYKQKTKASRDAATAGKEPDLDRVAKDLGDKPKSKYADRDWNKQKDREYRQELYFKSGMGRDDEKKWDKAWEKLGGDSAKFNKWADKYLEKHIHKLDAAGADKEANAAEDLQGKIVSGEFDYGKDIQAQFGNKKKPSKYDDPKYKKGDWWDDPELQDEPDDFERQMMAKTSADRALKVANMSGPAVEDALNRHGIGDNWGGNVSWQHDPETGEVDGYDDEGGEYGSIRALGSGRYMVRKPGQKYGEGDKVKGLGDAVKALSAAVGDRY